MSYKTAHRMMKQIRYLLSDDDDEPLSGEVEMDETFIGGKVRASDVRGTRFRAQGRAAAIRDETRLHSSAALDRCAVLLLCSS